MFLITENGVVSTIDEDKVYLKRPLKDHVDRMITAFIMSTFNKDYSFIIKIIDKEKDKVEIEFKDSINYRVLYTGNFYKLVSEIATNMQGLYEDKLDDLYDLMSLYKRMIRNNKKEFINGEMVRSVKRSESSSIATEAVNWLLVLEIL